MIARELLNTAEAADVVRRPARTLAQWRYLRQGPPFLKIQGGVLYDRSELDKWIDDQRVDFSAAK